MLDLSMPGGVYMSDVRYGFYLRPSLEMCRAQAEIHDLLERQYGLVAAGKFMPHATIKGFFASRADVTEIVAAIDSAMGEHHPFPVQNRGLYAFGTSAIVLNIHQLPGAEENQPLLEFHQSSVAKILPFVHPNCSFTLGETSQPFLAHLTLAMADIPPQAFDEIHEFLKTSEPIGPNHFLAEVFTLWSFRSEDWNGKWWETLKWKLIHSWKLV